MQARCDTGGYHAFSLDSLWFVLILFLPALRHQFTNGLRIGTNVTGAFVGSDGVLHIPVIFPFHISGETGNASVWDG